MNEIKLGKKISEGKTVDVYESGDLAVKVFKPDAPKTVVFYEAFMDSKVEETGLNVPKIKEVELIDGKWAIATELIKGKMKDNLRAEIESLDVIDHIKRYDLLTRLDSTPKHVKLCHGNFGPENIVITDDNKVYIVDWIGASAGNASADVAKTYLKLALTSTETAEKYLNLFCKKTNTAKTYVQEWLPIMAASTLAKGVTSKEEKDLLFTWLDVVDYS